MRLTLRTLLSYLDDTLEPAQAKAIGAKVAESEQARELMEKIKQVTRKRRLTTPPTSGPGGIDANTIAEYLDNEVTPETSAELEQICLASEVHLAEVAACHQILTLVLGEPALVPPTAKQRMYGLVKGPEAIPFRKPPKAASQADQDLSSEIEPDQEDSLRLGMSSAGRSDSRNLILLVGGGALAAVLLAVAVWQLVKTSGDKDGDKDKVVQVDKDKTGDADKDKNKEKTTTPSKTTTPDKTGTPDRTTAPSPETPPNKLPDIKVSDVKVSEGPTEVAYQPANMKQDPVGKYIPATIKEPAALLERLDKGGWTPVSGKSATVSGGRPLLSLPGSKNVVALASGVEVTLWGNMPELTYDSTVLESRAILHAVAPPLDADLTLERGRIILRNKKADGKDALIRLRFNDPTQGKEDYFDLTLNGSDAAVIVERSCGMDREEQFFENEKDVNRLGPTALIKLFAYDGSASVRAGSTTTGLSEAQRPILEWQSRQGKLGAPPKDYLPPWFKGIPEAKDDAAKQARKKAVKVHDDFVKALDAKAIGVALSELKQDALKGVPAPGTGKPPSLDAIFQWQHAIRAAAATDDIASIYDEFASSETPIFVRGLDLQALQQWIAWTREHDYELLKEIRKVEKKTVAVKIMELFHPISTADAAKPATYQNLIDGLSNEVLPIRTLSHWHLLGLQPQGLKIVYDPAMPREGRLAAQRAWTALLSAPPKKGS